MDNEEDEEEEEQELEDEIDEETGYSDGEAQYRIIREMSKSLPKHIRNRLNHEGF